MATQIPSLEETIALMRSEILNLVRDGRVPADVASFGDLHDHIDANCLGRICDDDGPWDALVEHFGGRDAHTEGLPDGMVDYLNASQDAVHDWIVSGGIREGIATQGGAA